MLAAVVMGVAKEREKMSRSLQFQDGARDQHDGWLIPRTARLVLSPAKVARIFTFRWCFIPPKLPREKTSLFQLSTGTVRITACHRATGIRRGLRHLGD